MALATTLATLTLSENTDLVAWCPDEPHRLAVGTYQLDKSTGSRYGHVYTYAFHPDTEHPLRLEREWAGPGVFEMAWGPMQEGRQMLAAALTDGSIQILNSQLQSIAKSSPSPLLEDTLACCVSWQEGEAPSDNTISQEAGSTRLLASYSDGTAERFQLTTTGLHSCGRWKAHDLEAWAIAPSPGSTETSQSLCFTGGDDAVIKAWDERVGSSTHAWMNRREHGAGVCCIVPSLHSEHEFLTGSYDEAARLWDVRWPSKPTVISRVKGGGGVWRLRWHATDKRFILAACMQHGFVVLQQNGTELVPVEHYPHQRTLAYGADWQPEPTGIVATASFYDNCVHIWRPACFDARAD